MALDLESICPDSALVNEVGLAKLQRTGLTLDQRNEMRARSLQDFLVALTGRAQPIFESDIRDSSQLSNGVCYRSLERIFRQATAIAGYTWDVLEAKYRREAAREFARPVTVSNGAAGPGGGSFRMERR